MIGALGGLRSYVAGYNRCVRNRDKSWICQDHDQPADKRVRALPKGRGGGSVTAQRRCPGCAYSVGFEAGCSGYLGVNIDFEPLKEKQGAPYYSRDPLAAWALGYLDGVLSRHQPASHAVVVTGPRPVEIAKATPRASKPRTARS